MINLGNRAAEEAKGGGSTHCVGGPTLIQLIRVLRTSSTGNALPLIEVIIIFGGALSRLVPMLAVPGVLGVPQGCKLGDAKQRKTGSCNLDRIIIDLIEIILLDIRFGLELQKNFRLDLVMQICYSNFSNRL